MTQSRNESGVKNIMETLEFSSKSAKKLVKI